MPNPNSVVTVSFQPIQIITWVVIGLIAGFLAGILVQGRGFRPFTSIAVGLIGALIGGVLFNLFGLNNSISPELQGGITLRYIDMIVAFIGSLLFLAAFGRRRFF